MTSGTSAVLQELVDSPLNFIYACSVCCATFADAYEGHNETVQGLSDGINPKERLVTELYLGSCCHVFCREHIEGGGPPFHPAGQKPKAPCPVCVKEQGESTARELYSIRGFHKDEYDSAIPPIWFKAPPINLGGNNKEMEALRFQYLALIRYCQVSYRTRKPLSNELADAKNELATMQSRVTDEHSKFADLQRENEELRTSAQQVEDAEALRAEVQQLRHLEEEFDQFNADLKAFRRLKADVRDLETFRKNKGAILQHLKLVPELVEQNRKMKERLSSLGFAMALEPVPNYSQLTSDDLNEMESIAEIYLEDHGCFQKSSSSHTAGRSAHTSGNEAVAHPFTSSDRPLKRRRVDSPLPYDMNVDASNSRDAMPPPSKIPSRIRSVRGLIPNIRKKFSSRQSIPKMQRANNGDVRMYDQGHWRSAVKFPIGDSCSSTHHDIRSEPPYMTGALPVEPTSQASHLFTNLGSHTNASDFTFRASSPVKMNRGQSEDQQARLPTEPSYLQLMDGLSHDSDFELGLTDPRRNATRQCEAGSIVKPFFQNPQGQRRPTEVNTQQRWGLGHAFLHQSPNGPPKLAGYQRSALYREPKAHFSRAQYDPSVGAASPASNPVQQPARQIGNVFKSFRRLSVTEAPNFTDANRMA
ncbi:zinc ion binding [Ascochyta rabiei]|uniref:Zinc ion binding n=1 Tax=Didymella rabiei TaxID=5454 RepID=A0A163BVN1_DIDRA|nr:zinc ion binding [Ascochyta rabiei]